YSPVHSDSGCHGRICGKVYSGKGVRGNAGGTPEKCGRNGALEVIDQVVPFSVQKGYDIPFSV
ncbi:hypothetical protein, partial [Eisenbergiella massiliensis]|uniref:hypothetical protein n=1 Tax=Eisenbergiella massiliensis TaxID=1720294 RepID=UPI0023F24F90